MHISLFSILMTILWSTLLIALFLMLRKKSQPAPCLQYSGNHPVISVLCCQAGGSHRAAVDEGSIRWQILSVVVLDSGLSHRSLSSL